MSATMQFGPRDQLYAILVQTIHDVIHAAVPGGWLEEADDVCADVLAGAVPPLPAAPTADPPGPGKVEVLAERARRKQSLFHPGDAALPDRRALRLTKDEPGTANSAARPAAVVEQTAAGLVPVAPLPSYARTRAAKRGGTT